MTIQYCIAIRRPMYGTDLSIYSRFKSDEIANMHRALHCIVLFISQKPLFIGIHNDFTSETWWQ